MRDNKNVGPEVAVRDGHISIHYFGLGSNPKMSLK